MFIAADASSKCILSIMASKKITNGAFYISFLGYFINFLSKKSKNTEKHLADPGFLMDMILTIITLLDT